MKHTHIKRFMNFVFDFHIYLCEDAPFKHSLYICFGEQFYWIIGPVTAEIILSPYLLEEEGKKNTYK